MLKALSRALGKTRVQERTLYMNRRSSTMTSEWLRGAAGVRNDLKIGVAQTVPFPGDVRRNIEHHEVFIDLAAAHGAEALVFPELSITGYVPPLAARLATTRDDPRFDVLQRLSDSKGLTIAIGVPIRHDAGVSIESLIFAPQRARRLYSKQYLHADEEPHFVAGERSVGLLNDSGRAELAICYELSVPEHARAASDRGAEIYVASVAKTPANVESALHRLAAIARHYAMTVLMSNFVGASGDCQFAGRTAAWDESGLLLAQLNGPCEGIVVVDTESRAALEVAVPANFASRP